MEEDKVGAKEKEKFQVFSRKEVLKGKSECWKGKKT
jgi:hypothetical protein